MPLYREKTSPYYWCRVVVAGQKVRRSTGTANRADAEAFEERLRQRLWRQHKLGDLSAVTFVDARTQWLNETTKRTKRQDADVLSWFVTRMSPETTLGDITRAEIVKLRELLLREGRSHATVNRYLSVLRAVLRKAWQEWGYITAAPKVPMFRVERREARYLTPQEFQALLGVLPEHLGIAARFAVATGLRMRAMLSLRWAQVDICGRRAWIAAEFMKAGKTHGFPLSSMAIDALAAARQFQEKQHAEHMARCARLKIKPAAPDWDHVFTWRGKPIDDCNTRAFQDAVGAAGLAGANWHTLRHTFASWAVQAGVTLQELMKLGPWESYDMVLRYSHLAPDHLSDAVSKVAGFCQINPRGVLPRGD